MKEVIYLIATANKVERMTKNLPSLKRGELPIKVTVNIDPKAFRTPTIDKEIFVDDWREGIDMEDVEFRKNIITKEEAEEIKQRRLAKMTEILQAQGYQITKPESSEE